MNDNGKELDWVTERWKCKLLSIFERLKVGIERDCSIRHELPGESHGFRFTGNGSTFWVSLEGPQLSHVVKFRMEGTAIVVLMDDEPFLEGTATLCDDGVCRLSVKGEAVELWQFRRRALEQLFFRF
jgi:hypothetical protein